MINLLNLGLKAQKEIVKANNIVQFPTRELAEQLHKQGRVIVHKPASLDAFKSRDDWPPEAA